MIIQKSEYDKIVDMYKNGMKQKDIAKEYNVTPSTISYILRKNGIYTIRDLSPLFSEDKVKEMYDRYCNKERVRDLANEYNIDYSSVYNLFHKYGFEVNESHTKQQYSINENYFDEINTPNKAYIIGLLWADGCNMTNKHEIKISLQEEDKHILDSIKEELGFDKPLSFVNYKKRKSNYKNQYVLTICNKYISEKLNSLGMIKAKSLTLEWPDCINKDMYKHFIRGYLDGDGCIYVGEKHSEVSFVGTTMFIEQLQKILNEEIGIHLSIKSQKGYKPVTKIGVVSGRIQINTLLSWLYSDSNLRLERKYKKYQQFLKKYNINNSCSD